MCDINKARYSTKVAEKSNQTLGQMSEKEGKYLTVTLADETYGLGKIDYICSVISICQ